MHSCESLFYLFGAFFAWFACVWVGAPQNQRTTAIGPFLWPCSFGFAGFLFFCVFCLCLVSVFWLPSIYCLGLHVNSFVSPNSEYHCLIDGLGVYILAFACPRFPRAGILCVLIIVYLSKHTSNSVADNTTNITHITTCPYHINMTSHQLCHICSLSVLAFSSLCLFVLAHCSFTFCATQEAVAHVYLIWSAVTSYTHTYTPIPHPHD